MKFFLAIAFVVSAVSAISERERSRLALQNPDLYEGDILGYDPLDKNAISNLQMRWPGARIPFVIEPSVASSTNLIYSAMQDYHANTCVRFVPRTNERNYISIFKGQGCYAWIGMGNKGPQEVSLGDGCMYRGLIVHEFGHTLGFFHEQARSDRDNYLIIYWDNIVQSQQSQFTKLTPAQNILYNAFDHNSIMIYGNYAFSKDGRSMTMAAKNGQRLVEPYEKPGMTSSDIYRVRKMYNC